MQRLVATILVLVSTCSLLLVGAAVAPNDFNVLQRLTNDKQLNTASASSPSAAAAGRNGISFDARDRAQQNYHQPQQQQQPKVIANDLADQQVSEASQRRQEPSKLVGRAVINGNHATYVEPPADFKPIIYDHDKQHLAVKIESASQSAASGETLDSPNQLFSPASLVPASSFNHHHHHHQQQQQQQQQHQFSRPPNSIVYKAPQVDPLLTSSNGADYLASADTIGQSSVDKRPLVAPMQLAANDIYGNRQRPLMDAEPAELADGSEQSALKPSVGRWNDWHDMSIEPDLASSDSAPANLYQPLAGLSHRQLLAAPYRTRYLMPAGKVGDQAPGSVKTVSWITVSPNERQQQYMQAAPANPTLYELDEQERFAELRESAGGQSVRPVEGGLKRQREQQFEIKSGQPGAKSSQLVRVQPLATKGTKLPLNLISSNNLIKIQQHQDERNQRQPSTWQYNEQQAGSGSMSGKTFFLQPNLQKQQQQQQQQQQHHQQLQQQQQKPHQMQPRPGQLQRRSKRRKKSKINAEVRIQQLVQASQQQQQQQELVPPKQVNVLLANQAAIAQHQHESSGSTDLRQASERVPLSGKQPASAQVYNHLDQQQQQQQQQRRPPASPLVVTKRLGSNPSVVSDGSAKPSNVSHKPQRTVKRRRVKTLLPVGLSSWILGGIRDLDGRHWQLPSEVISRLAVNDIDFNTGLPGRVVPPAAGSVVLIGGQGGAQQVEAGQGSSTRRVPISQLIPR